MVWEILIGIALEHSQALAITMLGLYIAYETRVGVMRGVRDDIHVVGVGLYRVIERDDQLDEEEFRAALWDEDSDKLLASDLDKDATEPPAGRGD